MAKRPPKRPTKAPTPPTPILRGKELAKRTKAIRAKRTRETKPKREALKKAAERRQYISGNAFEVTRLLLEEYTLQEWLGERGRVERFWDESWTYTTDGDVAYDEIYEWRLALVRNKVFSRYMEGRVMSVLLTVESNAGKRRGTMYLTGAAAGDYDAAMDDVARNFRDWAGAYGRDAQGEDFSRVREVTFLIRRDSVHPRWRSLVRGRATERERGEDRTRKARRKRK